MIVAEFARSKDGSNGASSDRRKVFMSLWMVLVVCTSWMSNGPEEAVVEGLLMI